MKVKQMSTANPFDSDAKKYEEWFKKNDKLFASELLALKELIPNFETGIEIGIGSGIFAVPLAIKTGVEISDAMAKEARKKGIEVYKGEAEDLPINDKSFDFALMVTVDCFLNDVEKAFTQVHRILKEGGIFVIAFLDRVTELGQVYEKNKHKHKSYRDANFHSAEEIMDFLKNTGFEILDKRQTVFSLQNEMQEVKKGVGEGLFAVLKAKK